MRLRIVPHQEADREEWNALVRASGSGWAFHLHEVIGLERRGGTNLSFGIRDDERDGYVMVVQLHERETEEWGERFHVLWSRWGFCWADGLGKKEFRELTETFKGHIDGLYKRMDIRGFEAALPPLASRWAPDRKETVNPLMFFGFKPRVRYTYVVDLEKEDNRVLADCQQTTRNEIRRLERSGKYLVERAPTGEEGFREWWALHLETYARTGGIPLHEAYARNVVLNLAPRGICDIWHLKNGIGRTVANVTILKQGASAFYWWGGSLDDREIGANKYLLYHVIMSFKMQTEGQGLGHRWFETGAASPYLRGGKEKGIGEYKKSFGTLLHPTWTGQYEAPEDRLVVHPTTWEKIKRKGKNWGRGLLHLS